MITYIHGELTEISSANIVIEAAGVGYEIMMPVRMLASLPPIGSEVKIYTYQNVSENALDLYGFLSRDDLDMFKLLISVNGIGPKGGLSILTTASTDRLKLSIISGDDSLIKAAPGIGPKTAQKAIIELKDKISADDIVGNDQPDYTLAVSDQIKEAKEALISIGYSAAQATKAIASLGDVSGLDSEEILNRAIANLSFI